MRVMTSEYFDSDTPLAHMYDSPKVFENVTQY